jgi:hypothetical protein
MGPARPGKPACTSFRAVAHSGRGLIRSEPALFMSAPLRGGSSSPFHGGGVQTGDMTDSRAGDIADRQASWYGSLTEAPERRELCPGGLWT